MRLMGQLEEKYSRVGGATGRRAFRDGAVDKALDAKIY